MAVAVVFGFLAFTLTAKAKPDSDEARYLNPREMVLSPDGRRLYVMCEASDEVRVVDTSSGKVLQVVAVGHMPRGISLSPDGQQIYVANSWDDTVSVIDASSLKVVRTLATGFEPNSVIADRDRQDAVRGQPAEQRYLGHRSGKRAGDQAPAGGTRSQLSGACRPTASGCIARTCIRTSGRTALRRNRKSR